jgi:hypothetical protein
MQCCVNDVIVNKTPQFLASDPTDQTRALTISDPDNPLQPVILPLVLRVETLLRNVRPITIDELNSEEFPCLHLISKNLIWDPSTNLYEDQEKAMTDYFGNIIHYAAVGDQLQLCSLMSSTL